MKKSVLMASAGAIALAAATGAAKAADVMPVVVPVITPVVAVPTGPDVVVQFDANVTKYLPGPFLINSVGAVDVRTASGWGFQFLTTNNHIQATVSFFSLGGRVYRAMGDATVGVFANAVFEYGGGIAFDAAGVGIDVDYNTELVELYYGLTAAFSPGGFDGLQSIFFADVERGNFVVRAAAIAQFAPFASFGGVQVGYRLGPVTPYVVLAGAIGGMAGFVAGAGLEFEHEVGEQLTLTADALVLKDFGFPGVAWRAEAGFEYTLGAGDGPLSVRGAVFTDNGDFGVEIGIGLKFGDGRVTGTGGLVLSDLPEWFL